MIEFRLSIRQSIRLHEQEVELASGLRLLTALEVCDNLRVAAEQCGFSYRKAWAMLKMLEDFLGGSLVTMQRGRGSHLTPLGLSLLKLARQQEQDFASLLQAAEHQASVVLREVLPEPGTHYLTLVASDSDRLNRLQQQTPRLPVQLTVEGSLQALKAYAAGKCAVAGFHVRAGQAESALVEGVYRYFNATEDCFVLLEQRQQGLISRLELPVMTLHQIVEQQLRMVNRQRGSGTRTLLDALLAEQGISGEVLLGYYHEEHTHLAVATMVASEQADVGLAVASVAKRLHLHFTPLASEYYFLVFKRTVVEHGAFKHMMAALFEAKMPELLSLTQFSSLVQTAVDV